jgi:hypothetical protein
MSTIHYINECRLLKVDTLVTSREEPKIRIKPKSDETKLRERQEKGYVSRRNTCQVCYELKSRTGNCSCIEEL